MKVSKISWGCGLFSIAGSKILITVVTTLDKIFGLSDTPHVRQTPQVVSTGYYIGLLDWYTIVSSYISQSFLDWAVC